MELILGLLAIAVFFSPLAGVIILRQRVKRLDESNADLNFRVSELESRMGKTESAPSSSPMDEFPPTVSQILENDPIPEPVITPLPISPSVEIRKETGIKAVRPFRSDFWQRMERQFLENWTGILGSVIMVLGAGFLSIYAALKFNEFIRFLLLLLLSALPGGVFFLLKDREKWERQALWMRSISGAIFLFACLGSAGIPGLQWVHNPIQSMGLLALGIGVNLGLSSLGKKQEFASFHSLLSLLALSVMTPGFPSLVMAVVITLYALIHCYKHRWDIHLLLVLTGFFIYHLFWMHSLSDVQFDALRLQGAAALILIFLVSTFVHYRKSYAAVHFQLRPFLTHLLNWLYFSVGMYLYVGGRPERSLAIFAGSLLAFVLSHRAGKKMIPWLRTTSVVMGQTLLCATLISLKGWDVSSVMIGGFIYIEVLLFLHIMVRQKRYGLYRFAVNLYGVATLGLLTLCIMDESLNSQIYASVIMILGLLHHHILFHSKDSRFLQNDFPFPMEKEFSISGFLSGISGSAALLLILNLNLGDVIPYPIAIALSVFILFAYHQSPSRGLRAGLLVFLTTISLICWTTLLSEDLSVREQFLNALVLAIASGMTFFWKSAVHRLIIASGLIMSSVTLIILSYLILEPVSPALPGLFWLLTVVLIMEIPRLPERFKTMSVLFLTVTIFRHFMVHIDMTQTLGFIELRYVMDLALLMTLFIWRRHPSSVKSSRFSAVLNYSMDAGVLLAAVLIFLEIPFQWIPLTLSLVSISILVYRRFSQKSPRMLLYGLVYYGSGLIVLSIDLLFLQYKIESPVPGVLALVTLLAGLILFFWKEDFTSLSESGAKERAIKLAQGLERHKNALLLYSLALVAALFLYKNFDSRYLTLLWALECFLIFSASLFLGESHFRVLSQGGLFLCVVRLIFIDLSENTPLMKGFVFLIVGLLMLGTNSLYNRYKGRFSTKE